MENKGSDNVVKFIQKYKDFILFTIGTILVILSLFLLSYDKMSLLKSNVFDEIEKEKKREDQNSQSQFITDEIKEAIINEVGVNTVNQEESVDSNVSSGGPSREYIGYLEIKKINLNSGLVSKNSYYNNVDRNIQILSVSDYPDVPNGNVILAAHSGTSAISYFKNLYKLTIGDEAKIYFKSYTYTYKIVDIYNIPKNGKATIKRNGDKSSLTLITCTHNSDTEQTIYILEQVSSVKDGG